MRDFNSSMEIDSDRRAYYIIEAMIVEHNRIVH